MKGAYRGLEGIRAATDALDDPIYGLESTISARFLPRQAYLRHEGLLKTAAPGLVAAPEHYSS